MAFFKTLVHFLRSSLPWNRRRPQIGRRSPSGRTAHSGAFPIAGAVASLPCQKLRAPSTPESYEIWLPPRARTVSWMQLPLTLSLLNLEASPSDSTSRLLQSDSHWNFSFTSVPQRQAMPVLKERARTFPLRPLKERKGAG